MSDEIIPDGGWAHDGESPFRLFSPARSMGKQAEGVPVIREQIYEGAADFLRDKLRENPELGEHRAIWYDLVKSYLKQQLTQEPTDEFAGEVLQEVFERVKLAEKVAPGVEVDIDLFDRPRIAFAESNIVERAGRCWELMDENERTAVRIGMSPLWVTQQDLGGKAVGEGWGAVQGDEHRQLAVALMQLAREQGGMIARKLAASAWEEEQARGWNENITPGASVQWYQEGSRSPNLGDVIEIDPEYQTYKVRDAYTGEVSVVSRVKLFSKKVSSYIDPANPPVNVVGSIPSEDMTIFEQDGKYWKVPGPSVAWGEWDGAIEISKEDFEYSLNPDKNLPLGFASKRAVGPLQSGRGEKLVPNIGPWATIEPNEEEGMVMLRWEGTNGLYGSGDFASEEEVMQHVQKLLDAGILINTRTAAFDESKHPRDESGQFGAGGGESAEPGSDEFMSRMLEVGPGPGDRVRLKDGTEAEWSEENMNQVDSWMPEMGPQQWFATQGEKPKKKKRSQAQYSGAADECPGCSGMGKEIEPGVYQCSGCGGVFGNLTDWAALQKYVDMNQQMESGVPDEDLRYFDFTIGDSERTHGFYDQKSKRVVQLG